MTVQVAASILSADFARLGTQVSSVCKKGADLIHIDVMDGSFVPNLTFGAQVISAIKPYSQVPFDVHLLMRHPEKYIDQFIKAGADRLTVHQEITADVPALLKYIRKQGVRAGLCLKPKTSADKITPFLDQLDIVLIMTVEPGFGGQPFMQNKLSKIAEVKKLIGKRAIEISVDGGINEKTGKLAVEAGADILVSGYYIFGSKNPAAAIRALKGA